MRKKRVIPQKNNKKNEKRTDVERQFGLIACYRAEFKGYGQDSNEDYDVDNGNDENVFDIETMIGFSLLYFS